MRRRALLLLPLALAGCSGHNAQSGASAGEARQLDDAAAKLDAQSADPNATDANQTGEDQ